SRDAGESGQGVLRTPAVTFDGSKMTVNADVAGELRVRLVDSSGNDIEGFAAADCTSVKGDSLTHEVKWQRPLTELRGKPVQFEFVLSNAKLYAFEVGS